VTHGAIKNCHMALSPKKEGPNNNTTPLLYFHMICSYSDKSARQDHRDQTHWLRIYRVPRQHKLSSLQNTHQNQSNLLNQVTCASESHNNSTKFSKRNKTYRARCLYISELICPPHLYPSIFNTKSENINSSLVHPQSPTML
jgi:hypothetical protein